jgi:methionyl-tRNA formyltransferase
MEPNNGSGDAYVLATSTPWNELLAARLRARLSLNFTLINRQADLNFGLLEALQPRYIFLPHWSYIIPEDIHRNFECVIFHMTNLPFGRGGSPLQNLIARGIYQTKMSALRCVQDLDAGPIYLKRDLSLYGSAEEIFIRASRVIEDMIVEIVETSPEPQPQMGEPTIFRRRRPEESNMEHLTTLDQVFDYIRMLDAAGYPAAFLEVGNFRLEFSRGCRKQGSVVAEVKITERRARSSDNE